MSEVEYELLIQVWNIGVKEVDSMGHYDCSVDSIGHYDRTRGPSLESLPPVAHVQTVAL